MANPQPTDAHLRVAHSINEAIMLRDFSKRQRKILDLILRLSWGCGKKVALIPTQRDFEVVGIREGHVKREIDWLVASKVITRDNDQYQFNKDFDQWQVSRVKPFQPEKLTKLVSLNLKGTYRNSKRELTKRVSPHLPKEEVSPNQKSKLATPDLATGKERLNKVLKKEKTTTFEEFKDQLRERFSDLDFEAELEKFDLYWSEGGRTLRRPKLALKNWMDKAREIQSSKKRNDDPDKYRNQKYGHLVRGRERKRDDDPNKFVKGKYGHVVQR